MVIRNFFIVILVCLAFSSCRKDFFAESGPGQLSFSNDSILFDTVFTTIGSATKKFVVYNNNNNPVTIETIRLAQDNPSDVYRINVDGMPIEQSQNIKLAPNDSLFLFIEVTINPNNQNTPFLVNNQLEFTTNGKTQLIDLVAFGQNANFYTPSDNLFIADKDTINFRYYSISQNTTWTKEKPHVIYGYVIVEPNATLTIEEGAQIYCHANSGLFIGNPILGANNDGGTLNVNGSLGNEVVFQGDRLEDWYQDAPGQWSQIWLCAGSKNSTINYAIIRNGTVGIKADTLGNSSEPTLKVNNTIIENMSDIGLFAQGSYVTGYNNLIRNCGRYNLVLNIGGRYQFDHCTFANYYNYGSRNTPILLINNYYEDVNENIQLRPLTQAHFTNCIIDGSAAHEIELQNNSNSEFNYIFDHCLIKLHPDSSISNLNQTNSIKVNSSSSIFINSQEQDFQLSDNSIAIDAGKASLMNNALSLDILGNSRDGNPDIGAYEKVD